MNGSTMDISAAAIEYVKHHRKEILDRFANINTYSSVQNPFTIFMAGSPGAGKTEFSTYFDPKVYAYTAEVPLVRIDADEIRKMLPGYDGTNACVFQAAATRGVEKLFDFSNHNGQNILLDTTFSDYSKAKSNIERSLVHKRKIGIFYIHLDPKVAWAYTQIREKKEGRKVSKEFFVDAYFESRLVVDRIKREYPMVELNVILKKVTGNKDKPIEATSYFKVQSIDNAIKLEYNVQTLLTAL